MSWRKKLQIRERTWILLLPNVSNLQYEINRIGRLPDTERTSKQKADLKVLQRNMDKVKKTHQKVSDYFDFIDYVAQIAKRGSATLSRISDELNVNPEDMTEARSQSCSTTSLS